jgi:hypothetical protein
MTSFADLFNPTFLIFLGIILLVTAILFLYFENKLREQNHKISSMFSLVSSLAEEVNGVKSGLNNLLTITMIGAGHDNHFSNQSNFQPFNHLEENLNTLNEENNLIVVSDDEDTDNEDEEENEYEYEDEDGEDSDNEDETNDSESETSDSNEIEELNDEEDNICMSTSNDIKILKLNLNLDSNIYETSEMEEFEELNDENDNVNEVEFIPLNNDDNNENDDNNDNNDNNDISSELKKINVNLEERKNIDLIENVDYKKLPLNKLRSVVAEKGLIVDASKLKKPEMLKLLGAE